MEQVCLVENKTRGMLTVLGVKVYLWLQFVRVANCSVFTRIALLMLTMVAFIRRVIHACDASLLEGLAHAYDASLRPEGYEEEFS